MLRISYKYQPLCFFLNHFHLHCLLLGKESNFLEIKSRITIAKRVVRFLLIHSANPQSRPVGIIVFAHVVRPSPLFKSRKTKQQKTIFATGVTMGLAEWIIDDTCLVVQLQSTIEKCMMALYFQTSYLPQDN